VNAWRMVGHDGAVHAFRGARRSGRLAHAYVIVGQPGVGRRTFAIRLAQELRCTGAEPPCFACDNCQRLDEHNPIWRAAVRRAAYGAARPDAQKDAQGRRIDAVHTEVFDLQVLRRADHRRDISIDGVGEFCAALHLKPAYGSARIGIVDGAHELNGDAASRLLKTLEEPPLETVIVLLTPSVSDLLPTIASRCRVVELSPVPAAAISAHLVTAHGRDAESAAAIAEASRGRPGWAITMAARPDRWDAERAHQDAARDFERADRPSRLRLVAEVGTPGRGRGLELAREAAEWLAVLEREQARALDEAMRHNGAAADAHARASLRVAVERLRRTRQARFLIGRNVSHRLVLEDLALRPHAPPMVARTL